jgi:subtilisin-like proprotein convertase family protein
MRRLALLTACLVTASGLTLLAPSGPAVADSRTKTNPAPIAIPDASHKSSAITVAGMGGVVTDVDVTVSNIAHAWPSDVDLYLQGPEDANAIVPLMSDVCGTSATPLAGATLSFDDEAAAPLPTSGCVSGSYRPTNVDTASDSLPSAGTWRATLAAFDGINPNGEWTLWAYDDSATYPGEIQGGFTLTITSSGPPPAIGIGSDDLAAGPATPYPYPIAITDHPGRITDVDVVLSGVSHTYPDDLDIMLVGPGGASVVLTSEACDTKDVVAATWRFDDGAAAPMPMNGPCISGSYRVGTNPGAPMPAPAPPAASGTSLSVFNGSPADGTWRLFVADHSNGDVGYITDVQLQVTTDAPPETTIIAKPKKSTTRAKATIAFVSTVYGANKAVSYQCKVDRKKWKVCSSPLRLKRLSTAKHKVRVRAIDGAGKVDPTPAVVAWKVHR